MGSTTYEAYQSPNVKTRVVVQSRQWDGVGQADRDQVMALDWDDALRLGNELIEAGEKARTAAVGEKMTLLEAKRRQAADLEREITKLERECEPHLAARESKAKPEHGDLET